MMVVLPPDSMTVVCADTMMLPGDYATIESCGDPDERFDRARRRYGLCDLHGATDRRPVTDTFCLVVCDDLGFCDTTITIIEIPETTPDTMMVVLTTGLYDGSLCRYDYATG